MTIFLSGGCKNGKSTLAEACAAALAGDGPLYYVATMIPRDDEDRARIRRHVSLREGKGFATLEQGRELLRCLGRCDSRGTFLLDSVTALLANEMFRPGAVFDGQAPARVAGELTAFARQVGNAVFVSDFLCADAGPYDEYTEAYRRGLALCERALAARCGAAGEVCAGLVTLYKGELPV